MTAPKVDASYVQDLRQAVKLLQDVVKDRSVLAGCLRLSIHDAFAYDSKKRVYGANASIRTQKELSHVGNEGLSDIVASLGEIKSAVPNISFADLYQLAGIVAIKAAGGPSIPFTPGRKDGWSFPPQSAYLQLDTGDKALKQFREWVARTGLSLEAATALLGAHTVTCWWQEGGGSSQSPFASSGLDNDYFKRLLNDKNQKDAWLLADPDIRKLVESYADDRDLFYERYADAHEELSLLGTGLSKNPVDYHSSSSDTSTTEYAITATEYAIYAASAIAATGVIAYGAWKWRQRYLRSGKLFAW